MKEAIGGGWLFSIVIVMILLFSSYVSLSTNYSRCYNIKDRIINFIELEGGLTDDALYKIDEYIDSVGYTSTSSECTAEGNDGYVLCSDPSNSKTGDITCSHSSLTKANFCVSRVELPNNATGKPSMYYYKVVVFFELNLPVLHELFFIRVSGETSQLLGNDSNKVAW